jgi:hypothetical protein
MEKLLFILVDSPYGAIKDSKMLWQGTVFRGRSSKN